MTSEHHLLQQELKSLRQLTSNSLTVSADLGFVAQFLIKSFTLPDYTSLADALIQAFKDQGFDASVYLKSYCEPMFIDYSGKENPAAEEKLTAQMTMGRLVEYDDTLQINYPRVSILIHNFNCDELRRGQLRDALCLLLEGIEARIKSLILADKEAEAQNSKQEFFALMSHELRTPLNPIIGYSNRLQQKVGESIDVKHKNAIGSIKSNAESLLRLLNHFIDFCKLEAGEICIERQTLNLSTVIDNALLIAAPVLQGYNASAAQQIPQGLTLHADPVRLTEIVVSLICNAARISRGQEIHISAELDTPKEIHLYIKACGTMCDANNGAIFESLTQRNTGSMNKSTELGMGLYLTKKLIQMHGGSIELNAGDSNTFHVFLPARAAVKPK